MYRHLLLIAVALCTLVSFASGADENTARIDQMSHRVDALSNEVAQLKASVELLDAIRPTTTMLMPEIAERFHVMHYAGEAEDWALAAHELLGIEHLLEVITLIDPQKGALANGFLAPQMDRLDAAIDHGNRAGFIETIEQMVASCNACHVAVGSPAMVVSLDVAHGLSLRHSHLLAPSEKPGEHHHKH